MIVEMRNVENRTISYVVSIPVHISVMILYFLTFPEIRLVDNKREVIDAFNFENGVLG